MSRQLSPALLAQIFARESNDPFLALITLDHELWPNPIRLVNNTQPITSRSMAFTPFPVQIILPVDDGETAREVSLELDNVSLEVIGYLRTVTQGVSVKIELILASLPNEVQMVLDGLTIDHINYNSTKITAKLALDNFLNTEVTSEKYTAKNFPGLF